MPYVLQLGLIGVCIALLPLSYIWVKADDDKFRKLLWLTTFLTLDLVMFGRLHAPDRFRPRLP